MPNIDTPKPPDRFPSFLFCIILALLITDCVIAWKLGHHPTAWPSLGIIFLAALLSICFFFWLPLMAIIYMFERRSKAVRWMLPFTLLMISGLGLAKWLEDKGYQTFLAEINLPALVSEVRSLAAQKKEIEGDANNAPPQIAHLTGDGTFFISPNNADPLSIGYAHEGPFHLRHDTDHHQWILEGTPLAPLPDDSPELTTRPPTTSP